MLSDIFIPEKIKVGYQNRKDTYTGKLAYIVYIDEKGKTRKEKSWNSWRDKNIHDEEFNNEPFSGFVLNKKVGGNNWNWNSRQTYTRVYDPRGFEFEITIPNLLYILENCNSIKGKGLEGEFVYGWSGKELILVPVDAPDYKKHTEFSKSFYQKKIGIKDMIPGATYKFSNGRVYVFLGRFNVYKGNIFLTGELEWKNSFYFFETKFLDEKEKITKKSECVGVDKSLFIAVWRGLPKVVQCLDEGSHPEYAFMMDLLEKDARYLSPDIYELERTPYNLEEFKEFALKTLLENKRMNRFVHIFSLINGEIACISIEIDWEIRTKYTRDLDIEEVKTVLSKPVFVEYSRNSSFSHYFNWADMHSKHESLEYFFEKYSPLKIGKIKRKVVQKNGIEQK